MSLSQDFEELYQSVILDHSRRPRNFGPLEGATSHARGDNPSCGDEIEVFVKVNPHNVIEDIHFTGQGCAISQASASLMTLKVKGRLKQEAEEMMIQFHDMLLTTDEKELPKQLGDLRLFKGVRKFPQRVKCATLAWQALKEALHQSGGSAEFRACCAG